MLVDPLPPLTLSLDSLGQVATLTLDRPPGNRFSLAVMEQLRSHLETLAATQTLRVVLLRAGGPDFSFGADLRDPQLAEQMASETGRQTVAMLGGAIVDAWSQLPVPTVVAARGRTMGAGACFFVSADFRFAGPDFTMQFPEVDRGMHLGWNILPRLGRELGWSTARLLALGGGALSRETLERLAPGAIVAAEEANAAAEAFALKLAQKPPLAVRSITRVFRQRDQADGALAADDVAAFVHTAGSEDLVEAMTAWFGRREGVYRGR